MINIAKLLKNCPKGTKLYSPLFGEVEFKYTIDSPFGIVVEDSVECSRSFDKYGRYFTVYNNAECLLFPSKECRTWENFKLTKFNFKVGDWIVHDDGSSYAPIQIYDLKNDRYLVTNMLGSKGEVMLTCQDKWRLWTIQDAKDGDVLVSRSDNPFIYNGNIEFSSAGAYVGIPQDGKIRLDVFPSKYWTNIKGIKPATKEQRDLLFQKMKEEGYVWDDEKKELRKIIKPKFNVGDWITNDTWTHCIQSISDGFYHFLEGGRLDFGKIDGYYRLWEISDARNGDVLVLNGFSKEYKWIGIFKALTSDTSFSSHCHYNCGMCEFITDIARCTKHGIKYNDIRPATNEERDILFAKMREAGYEWDADKKELRKIKPHYDIDNFKPKQWVLVRDDDEWEWALTRFSYLSYGSASLFVCINGASFQQCIPFEDNEKLLGTTDMCDEQYINW